MSDPVPPTELHPTDIAPGIQRLGEAEIAKGVKSYLIGLGLATLLTVVSFFVSGTTLVWTPSIPIALAVLAIAQMGIHLVFFLHIGTGPDNVNNVMALAFGVLIVLLVLAGSLWIMANLNRNMVFREELMEMQSGRGSQIRPIAARGVVGPTATASAFARVPGVVQSLFCTVKMQVKAGQICAKIAPTPYQATVDRHRAELQTAESRLEKDKADLASKKGAFEHQQEADRRGAVTRKAFNKAHKAFERAQAQTLRDEADVTRLKAVLRTAEIDLGHTDIASPIDGIVLSRNVELGQIVAVTSPPLFVIARNLSLVQIDAMIGGQDSHAVKLGGSATFTVDAFPNHAFSGTVTQMQPSPQDAATTEVVISAPDPSHLLEPGMVATIEILPQ